MSWPTPTHRTPTPFRVCAGGDVTLGTNLDPDWAKFAADTLRRTYGIAPDPDSIAPALKPFLAGADLVLLNVEGAIGAGPTRKKCGPRSTSCFAFRQPPSAAHALAALGDSGVAVVGNIANNHSRDAGDAGRDVTVAALKNAGLNVTGADTLATAVVLASGDTIGVLGSLYGHHRTRCAESQSRPSIRGPSRRSIRHRHRHHASRRRGADCTADARCD